MIIRGDRIAMACIKSRSQLKLGIRHRQVGIDSRKLEAFFDRVVTAPDFHAPQFERFLFGLH